MKKVWIVLFSLTVVIPIIRSEEVDAEHAEQYNSIDDEDDESLFAFYFDDLNDNSTELGICSAKGHCLFKREDPRKPEVETVGSRYAIILQYQRMGEHFKIAAGQPKTVVIQKKKVAAEIQSGEIIIKKEKVESKTGAVKTDDGKMRKQIKKADVEKSLFVENETHGQKKIQINHKNLHKKVAKP